MCLYLVPDLSILGHKPDLEALQNPEDRKQFVENVMNRIVDNSFHKAKSPAHKNGKGKEKEVSELDSEISPEPLSGVEDRIQRRLAFYFSLFLHVQQKQKAMDVENEKQERRRAQSRERREIEKEIKPQEEVHENASPNSSEGHPADKEKESKMDIKKTLLRWNKSNRTNKMDENLRLQEEKERKEQEERDKEREKIKEEEMRQSKTPQILEPEFYGISDLWRDIAVLQKNPGHPYMSAKFLSRNLKSIFGLGK